MDFLDIFSAQNECLAMGYLMGTESFRFGPNLNLWQLFKEGTHNSLMDDLLQFFLKTPVYNLGLGWPFWIFSVLKMFILSLAI